MRLNVMLLSKTKLGSRVPSELNPIIGESMISLPFFRLKSDIPMSLKIRFKA
jgi:hypothetical protein